MQKRLSLADLKAKAENAVLENAEIYMGGEESRCHFELADPSPQDGVQTTIKTLPKTTIKN
jgi:hypothetical protein